ncbi:MAG: transcriptional regulator [Promethearchaeia archaeon]|nr:MAG: transcriptional regulator [Candidatus Lokiarchaeia archaeon]
MKIVTINIPDQYLDGIETLVNLGYFPSRSEAVRQALKSFLAREAEFNEDLSSDKFSKLKQFQLDTLMNYK